jgi:hypothetical protein
MKIIYISRSFHHYFWLLPGHYQIQEVVDTEAVVLAVSQAVDIEVKVLEAVDLVGAMVDTEAVDLVGAMVRTVAVVMEVVMEVVLEVSEVVAMGVVLAASEAVDMEVASEEDLEAAKGGMEAKVDTEVVDLEAVEDSEEVMEDMADTGSSNYLKNAQIFFKDFMIKKSNYRTPFTWNLHLKF